MNAAIRLLGPYVKPYRRALGISLAAMIGEIFTALLLPVPVQRMVDTLVRTLSSRSGSHATFTDVAPHLPVLGALSGIFLGIALLDGVFTYLDQRGTARVAQQALTDLRYALFDHLQRLSLSFHHDKDTRLGELQTRLSGDVSNLQDVLASQLSVVVTGFGTATFMIGALVWLDWRVGLAVILGSIPVYLIARHSSKQLRRAVRDARRQEGEVTAILAESLSAAKLVQVLGRESHEKRRLVSAASQELAFGLRAASLQARFQPLLGFSTALLTALALLIASLLVLQRRLTVGELTLVLVYTRAALASVRQVAKLPLQAQKAATAAERIGATFARVPTVREPSVPQRLSAGPLDVSFDGVVFGYVSDRPVINGVSWHIRAGSTVALVGPTGAGKSTLLSLVPRLYDPWQGSIRLGGVDVMQIAFRELRAAVTLVLQESLLFRDTLWNNIAYGRPEATSSEILAAAVAAGVNTFVDDLENGYKTVISERGQTLSGGQKQCVAIARALLRRAPIVIMDEPTSNMDSVTEQLVIEGMKRLVSEATAIVIAHRLSTIRHATRVAILERGRIVQEGTPAQLLREQGLYARLSRYQQVEPVGAP
jgi:ATP-binding cassette subfamily B protein/subfamily B ATP-binding cassette protein MsbA